MAFVIARFGYGYARAVFKWPERKPGAYGSKKELRLSQVAAMRTIVRSGYWPAENGIDKVHQVSRNFFETVPLVHK
ncbi:hypothetical protein HDU96_003978, partial [Phlyctochytrium bullatum]